MKLNRQQFEQWENKSITLLGMSGVGKTTLAGLLPNDKWFHYSGDYRIGTRYLDEAILDHVKLKAMEHPYLRQQLKKDSIYIRNNITIDHLDPMSDFLGEIGDPDQGGLTVEEFKRRQRLFRQAEVAAMADVPEFIHKARNIYRYPHFINDAGGSICGLSDDECWNHLEKHTLILYLRTDEEMDQVLRRRARDCPKPLNYEEEFLDQQLEKYLDDHDLTSAETIVPERFVQWVFPALLEWRKPQYQQIADRHGYFASAGLISTLRDEKDFNEFVGASLEQSECR